MKVLKIFFIEKCFVVRNNQLTMTSQSFLRVQVCVDLGYILKFHTTYSIIDRGKDRVLVNIINNEGVKNILY